MASDHCIFLSLKGPNGPFCFVLFRWGWPRVWPVRPSTRLAFSGGAGLPPVFGLQPCSMLSHLLSAVGRFLQSATASL